MAREAIEIVRAAEEKAALIEHNAELEAAELIAKAGEAAKDKLDAAKKQAEAELCELLKSENEKAEEEMRAHSVSLDALCEQKRAEMQSKKENIIADIIKAVKAG